MSELASASTPLPGASTAAGPLVRAQTQSELGCPVPSAGDGRIEIVGVSGTSAGALEAAGSPRRVSSCYVALEAL